MDCFYEGENLLVINPDECIDCGDCETECSVEAIVPDTEFDIDRWLQINAEYSGKWPNIKCKGELLAVTYSGRHTAIIERRKMIKKLTIQNRRLNHQQQAA